MRKKPHFKILILLVLLFFPVEYAFTFTIPARKRVKVACVGNSITYGMTLKDRENESYPAVLQQLLGKEYEVGNFGKNGATLLKKGHRPYVDQEEYRQALAFNPDILVVHLGINDTDPRNFPDYGDFFIEDYVALIDSFKNVNPGLKVLIANLSPIRSNHSRYKSGTRAWRDSIRVLIPKIALASNAQIIDFGDVLRDRPDLLPDGVHPNKLGASLLAKKVYEAITGNHGGLQMPEIYGDHMVLQRNKPLKIKGKANSNEKISLIFGEKCYTTNVDHTGDWIINLPPMPEQTNMTMCVTNGKDTLVFKDISIGEVWIASGQSNMEFKMRLSQNLDSDKTETKDSLLRLFNMTPVVYTDPFNWDEDTKSLTDNLKYFKNSEWVYSDSITSKDFSAIAWHFGKILRDSLDVPVGIIANAVGGSPAESWIDIETLEHVMPEILNDWRSNDYLQPWVQQRITENIGVQVDSIEHRHPYEPSYLFASGIRPLHSYPIAGALWYQGESNAHNIELHEMLFPALLESWRTFWGDPELHFLFVQLSSIDRPSWPSFRDSQRRLAESNKNVRMAVSMDLGDSLDVHPKIKKPVGERLARQALNMVYSFGDIIPQGPTVKKAVQTAPHELTLYFDYANHLKTSDGKLPRSFEIAGIDGLFKKPVSVKISNDKVIIDAECENPEFVRYGWEPFSHSNLVNGDNLPASTFKIRVKSMEDKIIEKGMDSGLSGSFIGAFDNMVIMAGGCNFPKNPMSPQSKKKFYQGIYRLHIDDFGNPEYERVGTLPKAVAYGSTVSLPDGLIFIGGTDADSAFKEVYKLMLKPGSETVLEKYPSLPYSVDNAYAALVGDQIFLAGGNVDGIPSDRVFMLDLKNLSHGWSELENFPGNPRVQPVAGGHISSDGKKYLYLWGGFCPKSENREATLNTDGLRYDIKEKKWEKISGPFDCNGDEISAGGGSLTTLPNGKIVITGGVNKDIFLEALQNQAPDYLTHPVEWYRFNPLIFVFDPDKELWKIQGETPKTARAGAGTAIIGQNEILVIGGEVKPRIRTPEIYKINF